MEKRERRPEPIGPAFLLSPQQEGGLNGRPLEKKGKTMGPTCWQCDFSDCAQYLEWRYEVDAVASSPERFDCVNRIFQLNRERGAKHAEPLTQPSLFA